ncbi:hypothetical protein CC1G_13898 [Coprinopsis cinerea okayama7|uniref:F-box domain-containing protein n=1 Tax=Coprinopsis cinerea (strain Okayama-7 / 130 / ATCC MYA-4618 / FGSC 9003) TaxID=240176 RepID=D6RKW6_COPC7|nr:hypothetical protein CC1G_13898 [Coprinopsis cinerea okayama7\|eukprot:XP_002911858.1 hypothetical protein CC1G_13898 [Coprinopsis cinerea okayama7\
MCLTHLITSYSLTELREDILLFVPQHLRQSLVRYTSIHSPLPNSRLFALYEAESHANGEIIVIGPNNSIRDDYFIQASAASTEGPSTSTSRSSPSPTPSIEDDWEAEDTSPALLRVVAIVSTHLSTSTVLSIPPTITHLALIHLPTPIPLHRLPFVCPLLVFLDLSFNTWLQDPPEETLKSWDRVYWGRWSQLKVLGLRGCDMSPDRLEKVNEGRWDDVRIVRE